jgi:hypothetical protein
MGGTYYESRVLSAPFTEVFTSTNNMMIASPNIACGNNLEICNALIIDGNRPRVLEWLKTFSLVLM